MIPRKNPEYWPKVTCLPGVLPLAPAVGESRAADITAGNTGMSSDCYKISTARFDVAVPKNR
jgi:hypothetical protein